ncbi:MAG: YiiX/YebB-like N1pC/P60 family cysteine hydrolase [Burkholderiales bacterium]|nr:YiiX/YebB-like N1pC/P60 family cysteine hydrolase [Burkholderiales bacterium]
MRKIFIVCYFCFVYEVSMAYDNFKLKNGDLLFQDVNCGEFCDSIDGVTYGYKNTYVSHVAMVVDTISGKVVEAGTDGVHYIKLNDFMKASIDENGNPRVMVGRLNVKYQILIPDAIKFTESQIGKPYNATFVPANNNAFYCSELIANAFMYSDGSKTVFPTYPMTFNDYKTKELLPLWSDYYKKLGVKVPEGVLGTNPGRMSRESNVLEIIHFYGNLRVH